MLFFAQPPGAGEATGCAAPHSGQNFGPPSSTAPHPTHFAGPQSACVPHSGQNFASRSFAPHAAHSGESGDVPAMFPASSTRLTRPTSGRLKLTRSAGGRL